jgi:hypothetical protein
MAPVQVQSELDACDMSKDIPVEVALQLIKVFLDRVSVWMSPRLKRHRKYTDTLRL